MTLEQCGVRGVGPPSKKSVHNFWHPQNLTTLGIHGGLSPGPLRIPKFTNVQAPCIKWPRSIHAVSPGHLQTLKCGSQTGVYWQNLCVSGPAEFKLMLFKGQLYYCYLTKKKTQA